VAYSAVRASSNTIVSDLLSGRRALVTGASGQDGSYLVELLLERGYAVTGLVRSEAAAHSPNLAAVRERMAFVHGELEDHDSLREAVATVAPHELYHFAAPTFVPASWERPVEVLDAVAGATSALLLAAHRVDPAMRVFVASSSEVFGDAGETPQRESSPMRPRSPYGVAKLAAHGMVGTLRERLGLFAVSGIFYNHESPRRPQHFLPRKVSRGAAAVALGRREELVLGDLEAVRDWSHARDVVRGAHLALQADVPRDYVLSSGRGHRVRDLVDAAFAAAGVSSEGRIRVDPAFLRPPEATAPIGDPSRAARELAWRPEISFEAMIAEMVAADLAELRAGAEV
jgi:GDPmannose 4,6-dehydratase